MISVVIPYFNDHLYIDEAVDSILQQTYQDVEIYIVNDGSTDSAAIEKLKNYNKPKTQVLHKENGHLASARNYGIKHTESEYVLLLDADDKFKPDFLEKAIKVLDQKSEVGAVTAVAELFGAREGVFTIHTGGKGADFVVNNNAVACALIRRSLWEEVGGYDESMKDGFEDWDFWLSIIERGWVVHVIQEPLFLYRQKNTSMLMGSNQKRPELLRYLIGKHKEVFRENVELAVYERELLIANLREKCKKIQSSNTFKLGYYLTLPLRFLKTIFNLKKRS